MEFELHTDEKKGFKFKYPKTWNKFNAPGLVVAFSPAVNPLMNEPCLTLFMDNTRNFTFEQLTKALVDDYLKTLPAISDVVYKDLTINNVPAQQRTIVRIMNVIMVKQNTYFMLNLTCPVNSLSTIYPLAEYSINSFEITLGQRSLSMLTLRPFYNSSFSYFIRIPTEWSQPIMQQKDSVVKFKSDYNGVGYENGNNNNNNNNSKLLVLVSSKPVGNISLEEYLYYYSPYLSSFFFFNASTRYGTLLLEQILEDITACSADDLPSSLPSINSLTLGGQPGNSTNFYSAGHHSRLAWTVYNKCAYVISMIDYCTDKSDLEINAQIYSRITNSFSFVANREEGEIMLSTNLFEDLAKRFSIHYPKHYVKGGGVSGSSPSFSQPEEQGRMYYANFNVKLNEMEMAIDLNLFSNVVKAQLGQPGGHIQQAVLEAERDISIAGVQWHELFCSGILGNTVKAKISLRMAVIGTTAVMIFFGSEKKEFASEYNVVLESLNSFKFL